MKQIVLFMVATVSLAQFTPPSGGGGGSVNAVTATAPATSTGGTNPNIGVAVDGSTILASGSPAHLAVNTATMLSRTTGQQQQDITVTCSGSSSSALTCSSAGKAMTAYANGMRISVIADVATSGSGETININSLGAKSIYQNDGASPPTAAQIRTGSATVNGGFEAMYIGALNSGAGAFVLTGPALPACTSSLQANCVPPVDSAGNLAVGNTVLNQAPISIPATPTLTVHCTITGGETCSTTYQYAVAALSPVGASVSPYAATITNGPDTLTSSNYIAIASSAVDGTTSCIGVRGNIGAGDFSTGAYGPGALQSTMSPNPYQTFTCGAVFNDTGTYGDYSLSWDYESTNAFVGSAGASTYPRITSCLSVQDCQNRGEQFGLNSIASAFNSTAIGLNSIASGFNSTAIGFNSTAIGLNSIAIGLNSTASGGTTVAIGAYSIASGQGSTAIGQSSVDSGNYSIALGYCTGNQATLPDHSFTIGGSSNCDSNSYVSDWFTGTPDTTVHPVVIHGAPVTGSNIAGSNLSIAGGQSTGSGAGGAVIIATSQAGSSGTSQNALVNRLAVNPDGTVQFLTDPPGSCSGQPHATIAAVTVGVQAGVLVSCP